MVRGYISVDWSVSPRIVTVADTETSVLIQDLYDTLRFLESEPSGMDNDSIVAGAGKDILGPDLLVGLTITLLNAKLAFQARSSLPFVQCSVSGGNLVAMDETGATMDPIQTTAFTQVIRTASSSATLTDPGVWDYPLEGALTAKQLMRLMSAVLAGKLSGAETKTITIRDANDTMNRIVAGVDSDGNRLSIAMNVGD